MDGLTAVREIRNLQKKGTICGHIPTIAVTANARPDQIKAAMDAGMVSSLPLNSFRTEFLCFYQDDITTKPYRIGEMLAQIKNLAYKHA